MRKILICLFLVLLVALLIGVLWPFETRLNDTDVAAITYQVALKTSDPIKSIQSRPRWGVRVETGVSDGPLSGGDQIIYLRRSWTGWRIYKEEIGIW